MKKLTLFSPIYSYTAETLVNRIHEADDTEDLEIYLNSPGGSVFAGWSIIGVLQERAGKTTAKVYGDASSMAFYMLLFMDKVEALDVSTFMIHRADGYAESDEDKKFLSDVNKSIREKLEAKIDPEKFKSVTGHTFDDIFSMEGRLNVNLNAKQAKQIGLVDKIFRLEPNQIKAYTERFVAFADFDEQGSELELQGSNAQKPIFNNNINTNKMTREEFKAQNPEVYEAIKAEGAQAEKDRVAAFMAFVDIDADEVKKEIEAGSQMTNKFMAEMTRKSISKAQLEAIKTDSPAAVTTPASETTELTAEQKEVAEFEAQLDKGLNLKGREV